VLLLLVLLLLLLLVQVHSTILLLLRCCNLLTAGFQRLLLRLQCSLPQAAPWPCAATGILCWRIRHPQRS
jgi:hypothetical protein